MAVYSEDELRREGDRLADEIFKMREALKDREAALHKVLDEWERARSPFLLDPRTGFYYVVGKNGPSVTLTTISGPLRGFAYVAYDLSPFTRVLPAEVNLVD